MMMNRGKRGARAALALLGMLAACGGGDGGSSAPEGIEVRMGDTVVKSGERAIDFKAVPVMSVFWDPALGSMVSNNVGFAQLQVISKTPDNMAGEYLTPTKLEGDGASAFVLDIDDSIPTNYLIYVQCVPPSKGTFEAELVSGVAGMSGEHRVKMRCESADDYAMLPATAMRGGEASDRLWLVGGKWFEASEKTIKTGMNWPDFAAYGPTLGPVTRDGKKLPFMAHDPFPGVTPMADYRYYVYDADAATISAALTAEEGAKVDRFQSSAPILSDDGKFLYYADKNGVHQKTLGGALKDFTPATPPANAIGTYYLLHVSADGAQVLYFFANMTNAIATDALWVLDTRDGSSKPWGFFDASGQVLAGAPAVASELVLTPGMTRAMAGVYVQGSVDIWSYDATEHKLDKRFEEAKTHVATLKGTTGTIMQAGFMTLTPDGKSAAVVFNDWSDTSYWGGPKAAYITDLDTGKVYSYGLLPDGTPLSGDGWFYSFAGIAQDGSHAYATVAWNGGVNTDMIAPFTLVVPRAQWQELGAP